MRHMHGPANDPKIRSARFLPPWATVLTLPDARLGLHPAQGLPVDKDGGLALGAPHAKVLWRRLPLYGGEYRVGLPNARAQARDPP
jgi:hypothetical protein